MARKRNAFGEVISHKRRHKAVLLALRKQLQESSNTAARANKPNSHYRPRLMNNPHKTPPLETKMGREIYNKLWGQVNRRVTKWANLTAAEFRNTVPVDTGNLRDAVGVLSIVRDKPNGKISAIVGIDSDKVVSSQPRIRPATGKGSHKRGQMVKLPDYDYSPFVLGESNTSGRVGVARKVAAASKSNGRGRVSGRRVDIKHTNGKTYDWTSYDRVDTWSKIAKKNIEKIIKGK